MKGLRKVLGFMFVFAVLAMLLPVGPNIKVLAESTSKYLKVNSTVLEYKQVVYVDGTNGNDTTGDGSKGNPFASIVKGFDYMNVNCRQDGAIVIANGKYNVSGLFTRSNENLNSKYNGLQLSLISETLGGVTFLDSREWHLMQDNKNYRIKLKFYGIIISSNYTHGHLGGDNWVNEYYNCVFDCYYGGINETVSSTAIYVENCLFTNKICVCYSKYPVRGTAVNCASTTSYMDPYRGTKIKPLYKVTVDADYNIASSGWKNAGQGTNPDGSVANIGVYGGRFTWGGTVSEITTTPINLTATPNDSEIVLKWDTVEGATNYNIKRSTTPGGPYESLTTASGSAITYTASGSAISCNDKNVTSGITYYYVVSSVVNGKESQNSNEVSATLIAVISKKLKVVLEPKEVLQLSVDDDLSVNTELIWTSSDSSVAIVNSNGEVTALKSGNTKIIVTSKDGSYTDLINVLVVDNADDYRLAVDLKVGKSCRLTIDDYTNTVPVTWTSMDPTVATISSKGKVTAVGKGLALMIAKDSQGNDIGQVYVRVRE